MFKIEGRFESGEQAYWFTLKMAFATLDEAQQAIKGNSNWEGTWFRILKGEALCQVVSLGKFLDAEADSGVACVTNSGGYYVTRIVTEGGPSDPVAVLTGLARGTIPAAAVRTAHRGTRTPEEVAFANFPSRGYGALITATHRVLAEVYY